ncbi:MAG: DNA polymerase III subunit delta' [Caldilineae bacterium]|nr:MAG: DNA polymerase III subunit delta' [Caldilineae bacterium]
MEMSLQTGIVGHHWAVALLQQAIERNTFPHALLITGISQVGKRTLAHALAMALTCHGEPKPCRACPSCRKALSGNHPDIFIEEAETFAAETLKIEQIRDLQHNLSLSPHEGRYKIAILCDFERATLAAANALLKTLEEPPAHARLILTARTADRLLPTITSRCQRLPLRPVPAAAIDAFLQQHMDAPPETAHLLSRLAQGRPGWAIGALQQPEILEQRKKWLADLLSLTGRGYATRLNYAHTLSRSDTPLTEPLHLWLLWWRDVLLTHSGLFAATINTDHAEALQWMAQHLPASQIRRAITLTYNALQNFNHNVNPRLNLEVLLLNLPYLKGQPA